MGGHNKNIEDVYATFKCFIDFSDHSHYNHERNLIVKKSSYLDAFVRNETFPPFEVEIQTSSRCNLQCKWCIGKEVQAPNQVQNLANIIDEENVHKIVNGIIAFQENNMGIEEVKFSGFIGEPLVSKATLPAIRALTGAGIRVGLFTNGVLMIANTWPTLAMIEYVHVSLDAGRSSFHWLKEAPSKPFSERTFNQVLENISGVCRARLAHGRPKPTITVGYVVVPGNHDHIYETSKLVKEAGADRIRFKFDIGEKHNFDDDPQLLDEAFQQMGKARADLHEPPYFSIHVIHDRKDLNQRTFSKWQCKDGCFYQHFLATVGSDGNLYLCDHNTMPTGIALGNVINEEFRDVWLSKRRNFLEQGIPFPCQCVVCPPFGNSINPFLQKVREFSDKLGPVVVLEALERLRQDFKNSNVGPENASN